MCTSPSSPCGRMRLTARIAFALSPTSASCERVFALLKSMFGEALAEDQTRCLADFVRTALMLRYNKRIVG